MRTALLFFLTGSNKYSASLSIQLNVVLIQIIW